MTDPKNRDYYNIEALRGLVAFIVMLFVCAVCVDVGYLQAKKFDMEGSLTLAAMTGVEALPDTHRATHLTMSVANAQGMALAPWEINYDPNRRWIEIDKSGYYETMFLKYVGIDRIPIRVHVFDVNPDRI